MKMIVAALLLVAFGGTGFAFFQTHPKTQKVAKHPAKHKTKGDHRHHFPFRKKK
jgi:hypothetical protein